MKLFRFILVSWFKTSVIEIRKAVSVPLIINHLKWNPSKSIFYQITWHLAERMILKYLPEVLDDFLSLDHKFWWRRDGPEMRLICIFMMDWDRMKESVCRTPLDFMFTEIITIWQKSKIVKKNKWLEMHSCRQWIMNRVSPTGNDQNLTHRRHETLN